MDALLPILAGPYAPYLPGFILLILLGTAAYDAKTGLVPDWPLAVGALAMLAGRFFANGWEDAAINGAWGIATYAAIWGLNEAWYRFLKKDAVGMGDAKWTALAVLSFGGVPAVFAWFAGAWVSILWILGCYAVGRKISKVYFAPFLFCGLLIGLALCRHVVELPFPFFI